MLLPIDGKFLKNWKLWFGASKYKKSEEKMKDCDNLYWRFVKRKHHFSFPWFFPPYLLQLVPHDYKVTSVYTGLRLMIRVRFFDNIRTSDVLTQCCLLIESLPWSRQNCLFHPHFPANQIKRSCSMWQTFADFRKPFVMEKCDWLKWTIYFGEIRSLSNFTQ